MSTQGDKLKAIADAIREVDGTDEPIVANDFPDRIRSISPGVKSFNGRTGDVVPADGDYTAEQVSVIPPTGMASTNVQMAVAELFQSVSEGKTLIASAVTDKGVDTAADASFQTMHDNILSISSVPIGIRTITLSVNPVNGGNVYGAGMVSDGVQVVVQAIASPEFSFSAWKEGAKEITKEPFYAFKVNSDRTLTAIFTDFALEWNSGTFPFAFCTGITYGNGKFVAIFESGNIAYSSDIVNWTTAESLASAKWTGITYGNGMFVAISKEQNFAAKNHIAYSFDGITWMASELPVAVCLQSITYGGGKFVAVPTVPTSSTSATSNVVVYSEDGITWKSSTLPKSAIWRSVTYGGGKFVAVSNESTSKVGNTFAYSFDGITWVSGQLPSSAYWASVAYGNGRFVATASNNSATAYSEDGITWHSVKILTGASFRYVGYGGGKFLAVNSNSAQAAYSSDGENWSVTALPTSASWGGIAYGNKKFIVIKTTGNTFVYSNQI